MLLKQTCVASVPGHSTDRLSLMRKRISLYVGLYPRSVAAESACIQQVAGQARGEAEAKITA